MKFTSIILLLFIAISCDNSAAFYIGKWELNKENGVSTRTLTADNKLSWDFMGNKIIEDVNFNVVRITSLKYDIICGQGKDRIKMTMQKLSNNQCIGCTYKFNIDENMIDEVFIARKDQHPRESIPKPDNEVIILPKDYEGDFFIVYQYSANNQSTEIKINKKGIGINQGEPNLKQLFSANRTFRFEGRKKDITIANPNGSHDYSDIEIDSIFKNEENIVIQKGFNQSGRSSWNSENNENVPNNLNIEYFEVKRKRTAPLPHMSSHVVFSH